MKKDDPKNGFLPRYGSFKIKTIHSELYSLVLFLAISIIRKRIDIGSLILSAFLFALQQVVTHGEFYAIQSHSIVTKWFFKKKIISLPDDLMLILAKGSALSFPYRRLRNMNHLIELDDCYMICIVDNCTLREALNLMHWNGYEKENRYSNIVVREIFLNNTYSDFLYSFVFDREQVQKLAENHNCQMIVPKSLLGAVELSELNIPIHIDKEG